MEVEHITPYAGAEGSNKTEQVRAMFDNIAPAYDFMNRAMSFGIHRRWLGRCVRAVAAVSPREILDVATGTGDVAISLARRLPEACVTGIDLSSGMLELGRQKVSAAGLSERVELMQADCLSLPMADASYDAVTVAYGVRNFERLSAGYREMARVLRPGGLLAVIELSTPRSWAVRPFYKLYTRCIIPIVGRLVSHDVRAYRYLPESIAAVPQGDAMCALMTASGLEDARCKRLTLGTCTLYTARKPVEKQETTR